MNTYVYIVRHGQINNPANIFYGRLPRIGMSEEGRINMRKVGKFLRSSKASAVFSNPFLRARQSATLIQRETKIDKVTFTNAINEINNRMQGLLLSTSDKVRFDLYYSTPKNPFGETIADVAKRMNKFVRKISKYYSGKNVIVVSHGDTIMILRDAMLSLPLNLESVRDNSNSKYSDYEEVFCVTIKDGLPIYMEAVFTSNP